MRPFYIIIALQLLGSTLFGQEQSTKRNALYLSGDWMTKNLSASLSYERLILISRNGQFQVGSSLGYGRWYSVDSKGSNYHLNLHFMAGMSNTRGEFTLGLRCMDNEGDYFYPEPPEEPRISPPTVSYHTSRISPLASGIRNQVDTSFLNPP